VCRLVPRRIQPDGGVRVPPGKHRPPATPVGTAERSDDPTVLRPVDFRPAPGALRPANLSDDVTKSRIGGIPVRRCRPITLLVATTTLVWGLDLLVSTAAFAEEPTPAPPRSVTAAHVHGSTESIARNPRTARLISRKMPAGGVVRTPPTGPEFSGGTGTAISTHPKVGIALTTANGPVAVAPAGLDVGAPDGAVVGCRGRQRDVPANRAGNGHHSQSQRLRFRDVHSRQVVCCSRSLAMVGRSSSGLSLGD